MRPHNTDFSNLANTENYSTNRVRACASTNINSNSNNNNNNNNNNGNNKSKTGNAQVEVTRDDSSPQHYSNTNNNSNTNRLYNTLSSSPFMHPYKHMRPLRTLWRAAVCVLFMVLLWRKRQEKILGTFVQITDIHVDTHYVVGMRSEMC